MTRLAERSPSFYRPMSPFGSVEVCQSLQCENVSTRVLWDVTLGIFQLSDFSSLLSEQVNRDREAVKPGSCAFYVINNQQLPNAAITPFRKMPSFRCSFSFFSIQCIQCCFCNRFPAVNQIESKKQIWRRAKVFFFWKYHLWLLSGHLKAYISVACCTKF